MLCHFRRTDRFNTKQCDKNNNYLGKSKFAFFISYKNIAGHEVFARDEQMITFRTISLVTEACNFTYMKSSMYIFLQHNPSEVVLVIK